MINDLYVCACKPMGMSLQKFNYMGSKTLHNTRADRMEGRRRSREQGHNPSSCELFVAVRQYCKDKFNLVKGFSPFSS